MPKQPQPFKVRALTKAEMQQRREDPRSLVSYYETHPEMRPLGWKALHVTFPAHAPQPSRRR